MSAFKQFLASDIIVTPFEVNKSFNFEGGDALTGSLVSIDRFLGTNLTTLFDPSTDPTTGYISTQYQRLVYDSVRELYYSNYISSSYGDKVATASFLPGADAAGDVYVGITQSAGRYDNYLQSTLTYERYFPTASNAEVGVVSIPGRLFGDYIQPNSFYLTAESGSVYDDGDGNLILSSSGLICGNIFYGHGLIVITNDGTTAAAGGYGTGLYGTAVYGGGTGTNSVLENIINTSNITCSFSSSYTIYETQYKCTISENDFNFTLNPSTTNGSTEITSSIGNFYTPGQYLNDNVTGSEFNPYVTTVGLYNDNQELLAIGKLSQPLPTSPTTDTTILINIDR